MSNPLYYYDVISGLKRRNIKSPNSNAKMKKKKKEWMILEGDLRRRVRVSRVERCLDEKSKNLGMGMAKGNKILSCNKKIMMEERVFGVWAKGKTHHAMRQFQLLAAIITINQLNTSLLSVQVLSFHPILSKPHFLYVFRAWFECVQFLCDSIFICKSATSSLERFDSFSSMEFFLFLLNYFY